MIRVLAAAVLSLAAGCAALQPGAGTPPSFYMLERAPGARRAEAPGAAITLIVNPPQAAAGFDSQRILYVREAHKLEYFAHSEWVDPPARMLAPLLVAALEDSGAFRAVVLTPSAAAGELRLDTEIVRLQHEFLGTPSRVRFTLRASLVEERSRRVVAWREFEETADAASDDPYGGVVAANRAVRALIERLAAFCAEAAALPAGGRPATAAGR